MKFSIKDFFSKGDQIRSKLRKLKKSLVENFTFYIVKETFWKGHFVIYFTVQKLSFLFRTYLNAKKYKEDCRFNCIPYLPKKYLMENFFVCAVRYVAICLFWKYMNCEISLNGLLFMKVNGNTTFFR